MHAVGTALLRACLAGSSTRLAQQLCPPPIRQTPIRRPPDSTRVFCSTGDSKQGSSSLGAPSHHRHNSSSNSKPIGVLSLKQAPDNELVVPLVLLGLTERSKAFRAVSLLTWTDVVSDPHWRSWYRPLGHHPWQCMGVGMPTATDNTSTTTSASSPCTAGGGTCTAGTHTSSPHQHAYEQQKLNTFDADELGTLSSSSSAGDEQQAALRAGSGSGGEVGTGRCWYGRGEGEEQEQGEQEVNVAIAVCGDGEGSDGDDNMVLFDGDDSDDQADDAAEMITLREAVRLGTPCTTPADRGSLVFGFWSKCPYG